MGHNQVCRYIFLPSKYLKFLRIFVLVYTCDHLNFIQYAGRCFKFKGKRCKMVVFLTRTLPQNYVQPFRTFKKPFYKKPRLKNSKNRRSNKKLFRSITNFLRNLFVVSWHTLRNLTYFCSVFLIFLTYKKSIRNFFDQKLPKK